MARTCQRLVTYTLDFFLRIAEMIWLATLSTGIIFLEECFAYAGGGSNDNNGLLFHFVVFIFLRNCYYYLAAQKDTV